MRGILPEQLIRLAEALPAPLYVVGGSVRDFLAGALRKSADWDICSPADEETLAAAARACGLAVRAVYPRTGTVKLEGETAFEYTRFRTDTYVRGIHTPAETRFTDDIALDARRRDFCANAVYYDVAAGTYADPLGGIPDIRARILRTVAPAAKVFGEDGLRLLRLARIAAQTGFSPDGECLDGARRNRALIRDIAPERVFAEMQLLLHADETAADGPYRGLCILRETGVLGQFLPELAAGEGMAQRADFHDHDVLEHSFRCVRYARADIRWAALLHDVGKPACMKEEGSFHDHPARGARLADGILTRLKAPRKLTEETVRLVLLHMRDFDLKMRETKVRREICECRDLLPKLLALKQADFSACKDDLSPAPTVQKWENVLEKMRAEGVPFSVRELAVNGDDLLRAGLAGEEIGAALQALLAYCAQDGTRNRREHLLRHLKHCRKEIV